ncbi:MAG: hypothetical protein COB54_00510 [Alphaproteobacteria bacterium]|nr:MAG: hypothetical protein COB54_00510 [Alphaproteobacteria bacterium]
MTNLSEKNAVSPLRAGLLCRCPRCGQGKLYDGFFTFGQKCTYCDLDYTNFDSGDGPAVFIIMFLGFLIVGLALVVEVKFEPPLWLHLILWIPSIMGGSLGLLRPSKALMVAAQYHFNASEGKLDQ